MSITAVDGNTFEFEYMGVICGGWRQTDGKWGICVTINGVAVAGVDAETIEEATAWARQHIDTTIEMYLNK